MKNFGLDKIKHIIYAFIIVVVVGLALRGGPEWSKIVCALIGSAAASPSKGWQFLFASINSANIYKDADGRVRCLTKGARYSTTDSKTFSFAGDNIIINGKTVETLTLSSLAMPNNVTVINSWSKTAASYSKNFDFYALRIYNRLLTTEEMLYNQRVDNERFNLELTL